MQARVSRLHLFSSRPAIGGLQLVCAASASPPNRRQKQASTLRTAAAGPQHADKHGKLISKFSGRVTSRSGARASLRAAHTSASPQDDAGDGAGVSTSSAAAPCSPDASSAQTESAALESAMESATAAARKLVASLSPEQAAHNKHPRMVVTVPENPVPGEEFVLYFNRNASNALRGRSRIQMQYGFNNWELRAEGGVDKVELQPTGIAQELGADLWSCRVKVPASPYELNFILDDGEGTIENNAGQDFKIPVQGVGGRHAVELNANQGRDQELDSDRLLVAPPTPPTNTLYLGAMKKQIDELLAWKTENIKRTGIMEAQIAKHQTSLFFPLCIRQLCVMAAEVINMRSGDKHGAGMTPTKLDALAWAKEWLKGSGGSVKMTEQDLHMIYSTDPSSMRGAANKAAHEADEEDQAAAVRAVSDAQGRESLSRIYAFVYGRQVPKPPTVQ